MTPQTKQFTNQIMQGLAAFGIKAPAGFRIDTVEDLATGLRNRPCVNTAAVVAASSALFYVVERDHNPKVNDIYDAMIYCSTCLSVGYGDIFARTPLGKLIGTTLMTVGPALSGAMLDGKKAEENQLQEKILTTLQAILQRLPVEKTAK